MKGMVAATWKKSAYHPDCIFLTGDMDTIAFAGDFPVRMYPQRLTGFDSEAVCTIGTDTPEAEVLSFESGRKGK